MQQEQDVEKSGDGVRMRFFTAREVATHNQAQVSASILPVNVAQINVTRLGLTAGLLGLGLSSSA